MKYTLWMALWMCLNLMNQPKLNAQEVSKEIHDYQLNGLLSGTVNLSDYKGQYILLVNVASQCGYTPQYASLEQLYKKHKKKLVVIGLPCNQFGGQEPGAPQEIARFCKKNYNVSFPMTEKVAVKGEAQHPLYAWLTQKALNGYKDSEVRWNFHKYLVNPDGKLIGVYPSSVTPDSPQIISAIAG